VLATSGRIVLVLALLLTSAVAAEAQVRQPIGRYVIDFRGFYTGLGQDPRTAGELGLTRTDLPARGLGAVGGIHLYLLRRPEFAFGIGGEFLAARGRKVPVAGPTSTPPVLPAAPVVEQRLVSLSPQLSINFGRRDGWSYLTAGMGPLSLETFTGVTRPSEPAEKKNTLNLGGGARWFFSSHVAFHFDVRFYLTRPSDTTPSHPGRNRQRLRILSAGIALR
jgi:hypothetical protein